MNAVLGNVGIIGGADGPTAVFVTGSFPWELLLIGIGVVALAYILIRRRKK